MRIAAVQILPIRHRQCIVLVRACFAPIDNWGVSFTVDTSAFHPCMGYTGGRPRPSQDQTQSAADPTLSRDQEALDPRPRELSQYMYNRPLLTMHPCMDSGWFDCTWQTTEILTIVGWNSQ